MIELDSVSWRNFLSYGDYTTRIPLAALGQCLITGEVLEQQQEHQPEFSRDQNHSNGSGKSSVPNAILWTLFGRTMHSAQPGTKVVNWYTKATCHAEVLFKSGDRVSRTVTPGGRTELLYVRDGDQQRLVAETVATTRLMQQKLNREFRLDWDVFCGSCFFTQYSRPWMEMGDQARKQAIERMLHVDRYSLYGQIAGEKAAGVDRERTQHRAALEGLRQDLERLQQELREHREALDNFEQLRRGRQQEVQRLMESALAQRDRLQLPDLQKLEQKWEVVSKVRAKVQSLKQQAQSSRDKADGHRRDRDSHRRAISDLARKISDWQSKGGTRCSHCEQPVPHDHVAGKVEPLQLELRRWQQREDEAEAALGSELRRATELRRESEAIERKLQLKLPGWTLQEARLVHREWHSYDREAARHRAACESIAAESNPHGPAIERSESRSQQLLVEQHRLVLKVEEATNSWRHYNYLQKSYSDRKRIKSFVITSHLPYVNQRLAHYLDVFGLDLRLQFTNALAIESSSWGYDFFCGGERKRVDLAIMFAMFDLHEQIYGRQSNVMVLDEVDGRLDGSGVESLIQVIKSDLATKVETVLIISHRPDMHDQFQRQIHVRRNGRFSQLSEVR